MARVTLLRDYRAAGSTLTAGTELDVALDVADTLVGDGNARWTASAVPLKVFGNRGREPIAPNGADTLADLAAYSYRDTPLGTMFDVAFVGSAIPRRYRVAAKAGAIPDGDAIIEPADFDAAANDKILLRIA